MIYTSTAIHILGDLLRLIGLRDRLRCPRCKAVGTWKPHGGWLDFEDTRRVRRWLCKWCGYYVSPSEGERRCHPVARKAWEFDQDIELATPAQVLHDRFPGVSPWRG